MKVHWHSRPTTAGQGTVYSFQPQWDGLDPDARSWATIQLTGAGWIPDDHFSFYFLNALGEQDVETPDEMIREADRILREGFGFISHEQTVPAILRVLPMKKRRIRQSQPSRSVNGNQDGQP